MSFNFFWAASLQVETEKHFRKCNLRHPDDQTGMMKSMWEAELGHLMQADCMEVHSFTCTDTLGNKKDTIGS